MMGDTTGAPWRVLVVDDEENLNWSLVTSLRKEGYVVEGAPTAEDALRRLRAARFDCVVSDVKMPGIDGFQLLEWLREHQPGTRVIMMTAFGSPTVRQEALRGGVVAYFEKPFDLRALKEELRRMAGSPTNAPPPATPSEGYDLLDVAQVIDLTRRDIVLAVRTAGSTGTLRFAGGELLWAESGALRGDEAFVALCAPRGGWAQPLPWSGSLERNVTQPLSRLIYLALARREGRLTAGPLVSVPAPAAKEQAAKEQATEEQAPADSAPEPAPSVPDEVEPAEDSDTDTQVLPPRAVDPPAAVQPANPPVEHKPAASADAPALLADLAPELPEPCGLLLLSGDGTVLWRHRGHLIEVAPAAHSHLLAAVQAAMRAALLADLGSVEDVRIETTSFTLALCRPPRAGRNATLLIVLPAGPESRVQADATLELVRKRFAADS